MDVRFLPIGDTALSVEFGNDISCETNGKVSAFAAALATAPIDGVVEVVPSYRAAAIYYKPDMIRFDALVVECKSRIAKLSGESGFAQSSKVLEIPVLYGGNDPEDEECAGDMQMICEHEGKSKDEIIRLHSDNINRVYMLGFLPGLGYLNSENGFTIPRRSVPRMKVAEGSVMIWTNQTAILTVDSPDGWHMIGRTPVKTVDLNSEKPFALSPGLWLKFVSVDKTEYLRIKAEVDAGTYVPRLYEKEGT